MIIPFRKHTQETVFLNHAGKVCAITFAAAVLSYFFLDIPLAQHFTNSSKTLQPVFKLLSNCIEPHVQYFIWPLLFFLCRLVWKRPEIANRCLLVLMAVPCANTANFFLKSIFGRFRPEELFSERLFGFGFFSIHNSSFPSGHACTAGAIIGAIACFYPKQSFSLLALGFLISFTRVVLGYHYLSDIIVGLVLGVLVAQWIYTLMKSEQIKFTKFSLKNLFTK